ncbi:carboxymuconolactone decarboxylase family protein [Flaviaesturariibacter aridisoli]|uniref:Alkyl hydroperoxide reductase AhpD n=1 Tax=Flaviaesturariibacter aridisoli TaxID=2545761 RepID=A0A4R4E4V2_9BACT|nr:carboxymuconolactone decarboxylase family protein [Flaviaesturariibacter aridisoli]TCZ72260.1 alkylhydroperoxidase [Flaviaesturariibacter aridisoli]
MLFGNNTATDNTAVQLLTDLGLEPVLSPRLQALTDTGSRYLRDLKMNLQTALGAETLGAKDASLIGLAVAVNEGHEGLQNAFRTRARAAGATEAEVAEVLACTSLMNTNNVYYRFRHYLHDEFYDKAPAGIRMSIMASPVLGKELFELISLAVSALNGCELCVTSHEKALVGHGTEKIRIHDAVRLSAVVKSLVVLL